MGSTNERKWFLRPGRSALWVLVSLSAAYVAIRALELLITYPASAQLNWTSWLNIAGALLGLFWYAMFVIFAQEGGWFGKWRRPINAAILGAVVTGIAWWQSASPEALAAWAGGSLFVGYFADIWVEGL